MKKTRNAVLISLIVVTIVLTFYQVDRRVSWDIHNKRYTVLVRYGDVDRASPIFGSDPGDLAGELADHGVEYVLFRMDLASEGEPLLPDLSTPLEERGLGAGLEVTNLQLAGPKEVEVLFDFLNSYSPELLVLRALPPNSVPERLKEWIGQNDPVLGEVEFRQDSLTEEVARETGSKYIRLHRVFDKEVGTLSGEKTVSRYVRAVKERNIGAVEFRIPLNRDLDGTLADLDEIQTHLQGEGYSNGGVKGAKGAAGRLETPVWLLTLLIAGGLTATVLLMFIGRLPGPATQALLFGGFLVMTVVGMGVLPIFTRQAAAFLLALGGPVVAYRLLTTYGLSFQDKGFTFLRPFVDLLFVSVISTTVGLVISAVLTDQLFMLKLEQFRGVKGSLFFPLLFIAALYVFRVGFNSDSWSLGGVKWLILAAFGALMVFLLLRSGNFTILESSDLEDAFRRWLERNLSVRPRFKEFAIGGPAALLWLYFVNRHGSK
ncbi:MAG: DUF5693 family protein, partial [Candidatus Bipolaricaulota bacterium]